MTDEAARIFLNYSAENLQRSVARIEDCLERLNYDQIWLRGSDASNAVGNLVLHLAGNVRQWIGHGVAGQPNVRDRDAEFAARGGPDATELLSNLRATVNDAAAAIAALAPQRLTERASIQGYDVTLLEAIYHVIEHFAQHTAQILFATKLLTNHDLGYYRHLGQPAHSEKTP